MELEDHQKGHGNTLSSENAQWAYTMYMLKHKSIFNIDLSCLFMGPI